MFEQIFKNIDDTFRKDSGCSTELDYAEQSSWILFLKWLDDYEHENKIKAELGNKNYTPILESEFQWNNWAVTKNSDGTIDHNKSLTGPDLKDFVDNQLFEYLKDFRTKAEDTQTIEYKIGEVFHELKNKLQDGYTLRDILDQVDKLKFNTNENKFELSSLYEDKIKNMGNAGRNGGEYYTPRPLINSIVKVINPKIGETVYDGAVGSAGFLVAAYENIKKTKLTSQQLINLQTKTLYGVEKKPLAYIIGLMNMMLHGIESPNLTRRNTLEDNISEIQDKDRFDIVLANPPFGGGEKANIQENFPLKSSETAYLFLQHFIKILKKNGRAGVVIKNTFLSNGDAKELRKQLLSECNLYAVLDLPRGTFQGAGVETVVLFFEKSKPTEKIWYYHLNLDRNLGKTNPLNEKDLTEFVEAAKTQQLSDNSWLVDLATINKDTWDLTVNNPNTVEEVDNRTPQEIIAEIEKLDVQAAQALQAIKELL